MSDIETEVEPVSSEPAAPEEPTVATPDLDALFSAAGLAPPEPAGEVIPPAPSEMEEMLRQSLEEGLGQPDSLAESTANADAEAEPASAQPPPAAPPQPEPEGVESAPPSAGGDALTAEMAELAQQAEVELLSEASAEMGGGSSVPDIPDLDMSAEAASMLPALEELQEAQATAEHRQSLRGRLSRLAAAVVCLLVLLDKPFGWIGAEGKRLLGYMAIATLIVAALTFVAGPRLVAHLQAVATTQPAVAQ